MAQNNPEWASINNWVISEARAKGYEVPDNFNPMYMITMKLQKAGFRGQDLDDKSSDTIAALLMPEAGKVWRAMEKSPQKDFKNLFNSAAQNYVVDAIRSRTRKDRSEGNQVSIGGDGEESGSLSEGAIEGGEDLNTNFDSGDPLQEFNNYLLHQAKGAEMQEIFESLMSGSKQADIVKARGINKATVSLMVKEIRKHLLDFADSTDDVEFKKTVHSLLNKPKVVKPKRQGPKEAHFEDERGERRKVLIKKTGPYNTRVYYAEDSPQNSFLVPNDKLL